MSETTIELPNGDSVILYEERRSLQFNLADVYKYRFVDDSEEIIHGSGAHVPNVNDIVYRRQAGILENYWVSYRDPTTFTIHLTKLDSDTQGPTAGEADKYLATSSGYQSEAWRAYFDSRTLPYRIEIDEGFRVYGNKTAYIVIFRGVDTSESGEVISAYYNQSGEYVSSRIPMEVVANVVDSVFSPVAEFSNIAIKAPAIGYCTKDLREGEYLTAVGYTQDNVVVRSVRLVVHKTNVYRRTEDNLRRVTGIQLISPYLSETEPNTLYVPLNINTDSVIMRAKVSYSDGKSLTMDVGDETSGAKFMLYGFKYWSPTITGTPKPLTLYYRLSPSEEYSREEGETEDGLVREPYQIIATEVNPSLSLKVYVFPMWMPELNSYVLDFWLFDLLRQQYYKIPAGAIEYQETSPSFDGMNYLTVQTLSIGVALGLVDSIWGTHRHTQTFQVALVREGTSPLTNWRVKHSTNQPAWYGDNKSAYKRAGGGGVTFVDISCGYGTLTEWLDNIFYAQDPLYNTGAEARAPMPTHFILSTKTNSFDFPLSTWSNELSIINDLAEGQLLTIRFVKRDASGELQLGVAAMPLRSQM